jgi:hypothetical protein
MSGRHRPADVDPADDPVQSCREGILAAHRRFYQ